MTPENAAVAEGVYFAPGDYAGFGRRLVSGLIDAAVVYAAWLVVWVAVALARSLLALPKHAVIVSMTGGWFVLGFLYLVVLKRSALRTLGYRAAGIRVIDLRGGPPSLFRMSLRTGLLLLGRGFMLIDLAWLLGRGSADGQKITDMLAGTYVVRAGARPEGHGRIVAAYYGMLSHFLICPQVRHP
jgi:uncharacterized RDD family membrane protein YckC